MARIRTIKPEFWTDSKIVQLPYEARLLFIGMWNFADDEGYLANDPEQLRLQVLPNDDADCVLLVDLLIAAGLVEVHGRHSGCDLLRITHFLDHQRVSHPTPSMYAPESSGKKRSIPAHSRRLLAKKYGCEPGGEASCECYYCGAAGTIWWPNTSRGTPGGWVCFSLTIDHFIAESQGGATEADNFVLACEACNKGKCDSHPFSRVLPSPPESSGVLRPEWNGIEGKGREGKGNTKARKRAVFVPPTPEEVEEYSKSIGWPLDGQAWCDSYAAKGWCQKGGAKLKDWKAAVRNWKHNAWRTGPSTNGREKTDEDYIRELQDKGLIGRDD